MNRKFKCFKQTMFLLEQCAMSKVTTSVRRTVFLPWCRPTIVFHLFITMSISRCWSQPRNSLFWCVKSLLLLWQPRSWF